MSSPKGRIFMPLLHARIVGDQAILPRDDFERLVELARKQGHVEIEISNGDLSGSAKKEARLDAEFEQAAERVFNQHEELLRRLA
jgi:hypothetical protein